MEEKGKSLELVESRDALELVPTWDPPLWWFFAAVILIVAIVLSLVFFLRKKPVPDAMKEKREAYLEAKAALSGSGAATLRESAIAVSIILRRYLARSMNEPALFETHEEFIARHDGLKNLPNDLRSEVAVFFSKLAAAKYAPDDIAAVEAVSPCVEGGALLERIHSA
ncbi:MAG: hypothetical protein RLZZ505_2464 [Verrucomicrobiota bacterium]|jgi:hypothetical protein